MKTKRLTKLFTFLVLIVISFSCKSRSTMNANTLNAYTPADKNLYEEIKAMDKAFFDAYNSCDLETQARIYSDDIEFFHDRGGLTTSKEDIINGTKRNICGKVTRILVEGSIEVYPINNYGAVQMGLHKFKNNNNPNAESKPSKFIAVWKKTAGDWKMEKVISLHE